MKKYCISLFLVVCWSQAQARPLFIEFSEMIKASKFIAVATYTKYMGIDAYSSNTYKLNIETVLKGDLKLGSYIVKRAKGSVDFEPGTRFIAFINKNNEFEWVGIPLTMEDSLIHDNTILELSGFYDYNAYLVSPSTVTFAQLKSYIKKNKYETKITGYLHCFSNKTLAVESTAVQINIVYTYQESGITSDVKINGLSWQGFPIQPAFSAPIWHTQVELAYSNNGYRPFTIIGDIMPNSNDEGNMQAVFWVSEPSELTLDELTEFINNEFYGYAYYEFEITTEKNEVYPMVLGIEMGRIGTLSNFEGKTLAISSYNEDPYWPREIVFDYNYTEHLVLALDSTKVTKDQLKNTREELVRELKISPIKAKILMRKDSVDSFITNCEIRYKKTSFTKNVNYGK